MTDMHDARVHDARKHRLDSLLLAQWSRAPHRPALLDGARTLTAAQLRDRACRVAGALRERGVGAGDLVAVQVERSAEAVIAMVGVILAGGAHVAFDADDPVARTRALLDDCQPRVLLTSEALRGRFQAALPAATALMTVEEAVAHRRSAIPHRTAADPDPDPDPDQPAVVIYTSGSTGRPKGSLISHRALTRRLASLQSAHRLDGSDRVAHHTAYGFDMCLMEIYWPLLAGATVVVAAPRRHRDAEYLGALLRDHSVTTFCCVVSLLELFLFAQPRGSRFPALRQVLTGGEPLSPELVRAFHGRCAATLTNLYGPSECTIYCAAWPCPNDPDLDTVLIGTPIEETTLRVLDEAGTPVPEGEPGELYIGGTGLSLGYLNRPELTAERFVPDPFGAPDDRLYRSGDLVRQVPGQGLQFLGRSDHQVKIRGFRTEIGEIEAVARRSPLVRQCAVVALGTGNAARLVAFVVPHDTAPEEPEPLASSLRHELAGALPPHMVPSALAVLDALPLTGNGKLDRAALAKRAAAVLPATDQTAPVTNLEKTASKIWAEVLGLPTVGRQNDFFDLGGNSLTAIQVAQRLERELRIRVPVRLLFDTSTLAAFAEELGRRPAAVG